MQISVIVPALNEAAVIARTLEPLQALRSRGHEVILADGGSADATVSIAATRVDRVVHSPPGRARQMNAGAAVGRGELLWFLHADTLVPGDADGLLLHAIEGKGDDCWGRFDVRLSGQRWPLAVIARFMNLRSRLSGIATGDQGMFVHRRLFERVGGFSDMPLMEDIDLSARLRRRCRPLCLRDRLCTSSRRWETRGILRTVVLMWLLRLGFYLGVPPEHLSRLYRGAGTEQPVGING